jgi:hypothetical protein
VSATLDILTCDNEIVLDNVSASHFISYSHIKCSQTLRARLVDRLPVGSRLIVRSLSRGLSEVDLNPLP